LRALFALVILTHKYNKANWQEIIRQAANKITVENLSRYHQNNLIRLATIRMSDTKVENPSAFFSAFILWH